MSNKTNIFNSEYEGKCVLDYYEGLEVDEYVESYVMRSRDLNTPDACKKYRGTDMSVFIDKPVFVKNEVGKEYTGYYIEFSELSPDFIVNNNPYFSERHALLVKELLRESKLKYDLSGVIGFELDLREYTKDITFSIQIEEGDYLVLKRHLLN